MHGGVVRPAQRGDLVMLMALYYEPLWIFYRDAADPDATRRTPLQAGGRRLAGKRGARLCRAAARGQQHHGLQHQTGSAGQSRRAARAAERRGRRGIPHRARAVARDLAGIARSVAQVDEPGARRSLSEKVFLHHEADTARGNHRLRTAHSGTGGQADRHQAMLVARDGLPPAIINLLLEAARELHSEQGFFEADDEFPNTASVDLPVSTDASRHHRFGPACCTAIFRSSSRPTSSA